MNLDPVYHPSIVKKVLEYIEPSTIAEHARCFSHPLQDTIGKALLEHGDDRVLAANVRHFTFLSREVLQALVERGYGHMLGFVLDLFSMETVGQRDLEQREAGIEIGNEHVEYYIASRRFKGLRLALQRIPEAERLSLKVFTQTDAMLLLEKIKQDKEWGTAQEFIECFPLLNLEVASAQKHEVSQKGEAELALRNSELPQREVWPGLQGLEADLLEFYTTVSITAEIQQYKTQLSESRKTLTFRSRVIYEDFLAILKTEVRKLFYRLACHGVITVAAEVATSWNASAAIPNLTIPARFSTLETFLQYGTTEEVRLYLHEAGELFSEKWIHWGTSHGGSRWINICHLLLEIWKEPTSFQEQMILIDRLCQIEHNGGAFLTRIIVSQEQRDYISALLDIKFVTEDMDQFIKEMMKLFRYHDDGSTADELIQRVHEWRMTRQSFSLQGYGGE